MGRKRWDIFFGFRRDTEERIVKRRLIEKIAVPVPKHKNKKIAGKVQIEKEYLILDPIPEKYIYRAVCSGYRNGRTCLCIRTGTLAFL